MPEKKREYGYYVFPLLEGDRLVGRIDMRRREGRLCVRALWPERGVRLGKGRLERIGRELDRSGANRPHRPLLRLRRPGLREGLDQGEPGIAGTSRVPSKPGAWSRQVRSQELPFFPDAECRLSPRQLTMSAGDRRPSDARFVPLVWSRRRRNAPFKCIAAPASIGGRARLKSPIAAAYIPPLQRRGSPP